MTHIRNKRLLWATLLAVATGSCGDVVRQSQSPVFLVINTLGGRRGGGADPKFSSPLISDVITNVTTPKPCAPESPCPTVFSDTGEVEFEIALKDIGNSTVPTEPTTNNSVTITRYRVNYRRADGRNTPGVDVPYGFDGAMTVTVLPGQKPKTGFELVRLVAKVESPLVQLRGNFTVITTIAEVTFFGTDRVGNDISATVNMQIDFSNFGDF
jgi:hypothetical protein